MRVIHLSFVLLFISCFNTLLMNAQSQVVPIEKSVLVGDQIVKFVPTGFDQAKAPSLMLKSEPAEQGAMPNNWKLTPQFTLTNNKACASLTVPDGTSLYGGGEVTGPLLRNGEKIKLWNTDNGAYFVDGGKRLYQTHPWVMGVRSDGTAFGILFESTWKSELITRSNKIQFNTQGALFRTFVIDRKSPQEVLKGLADLIGTINMPPRWALGYQQCRYSYDSETRVKQIADTFRLKKIPCDVIWMDIDYMDGYRVFTFNKTNFPHPEKLNDYLHEKNFHSVFMIDPGVKVDSNYAVYQSGEKNDVFVRDSSQNEFHGKVWPGNCAFPDFTRPSVRAWWASLYKDFMHTGIDGVWNDMNEPALFKTQTGTMPVTNVHLGGGNLPAGSHLMYHNAYGRLMVEASREGILAANPNKRPFVLTRSNLIGGQRYAATWTGDNKACTKHLKLSVPMSITLGLSGQPFNGPDIGGFIGNTSPELWSNWLSAGVFFPFTRGHACKGTNNKEPWAYGEQVESMSRIALERRYRLLPYLYTLFYTSSVTGLPIMNPVFFADVKDLKLRAEQQAFLLGNDLLVIPSWAVKTALPSGIWEDLHLVEGDQAPIQATLKIRGGAILPVGRIIENTQENSFDPLTLVVCLDQNGEAAGNLYWDKGDGFEYQQGEYKLLHFVAKKTANQVTVDLTKIEGQFHLNLHGIQIELLYKGKVYTSKKLPNELTDGSKPLYTFYL